MEAASVKLPPNFDMRAENAVQGWKLWIASFEDYLVATGNDESTDRIRLSLLRNMMGQEASRILLTLPLSKEESQRYDSVIKAIEKYISPRVNEVFERFKFNERKQKEGEPFDSFLTECKVLLQNCNYVSSASLEDQLLRDKIVHGIHDKALQENLLRVDELNLSTASNICRKHEQSRKQVKEMNPSVEVDAVRKIRRSVPFKSDTNEGIFKCRRCQKTHAQRMCPAYGKKCSKCGILNHFAVSCRVRKVNNVAEVERDDNSSDEDPIYCYSVRCQTRSFDWTEDIMIEGQRVQCRLDTGAEVSIMPLKLYKMLGLKSKLTKFNKNLEAFQGAQIKPIGAVNLLCEYKDRKHCEEFIIVDCNAMLLGLPGCLGLNLVKRVHYVEKDDAKSKFIAQNPDIFKGHGTFPKPCIIPTVNEQAPICHPAARIPFALREPLKAELERLVKRKAIVKVDEIDPKACINRLVLVEKSDNKLRLCLDPADLNQLIVRKPKVLLTLDEISTKLLGKKYFSVFDLSEGFHHCILSPDSSWKCCFATPFGVYRYLVLPYGLSNSPDLFQDQIENYFGNITNCISWFDDLLVMGETEEAHDEAVKEVVQKAREISAVFNKDKLQYKQKEVKYVGQIFDGKGMRVDEDRIESLVMLKSPTNKEELQRIIGSFNYVRRYVPEMAELLSPLCKLLRKDVDFQWLSIHEKLFNEIKIKLTEAPALCPFNPNKQIVLQCDSSKNGIGGCLFQEDNNDVLKLVACVSRTMTNCELNYSQTEKELLAIYFGTQKFHKYIYGANVVVQTDHKPLLSIMCKPISKVGSPRLRRLRIKLLNYQLNLKYVPGKDIHFADMLSRSSLENNNQPDYEMLEMVHSVSLHLPMSEERKTQFRLKTSKDPVLSLICEYNQSGWPDEQKILSDCKPYYKLRQDIYVESGLVFLNDKIIVPKSLRSYVLKLVHEGHPGITKSVKRARELFYWPKLAENVQNYINECRTCEKFSSANSHEPLMSHKIPKYRYYKVGTDIFDYAGRSYLVIIDYLSHWLEVLPLKSKTSKSVINAMQEVFTRFGYPMEMVADNNPFVSYECLEYYKSKDITIVTSSPHYHRSNGLAEKAVNICKNLMKKAAEDGVDYRESVMHYNNTPLSCLEVSPSQILNSRRIRTTLPTTAQMLEPRIEENIHKLLKVKQSINKSFHDRHVRKSEATFNVGDSIVFRTNRDDHWKKGVVVKKCKEPRSYLISRDKNSRYLRRNSYHLKKSCSNKQQWSQDMSVPELSPGKPHIQPCSSNAAEPIEIESNVPQCSSNTAEGEPSSRSYVTRSGRTVKPVEYKDYLVY